jgi:hypothetical protein
MAGRAVRCGRDGGDEFLMRVRESARLVGAHLVPSGAQEPQRCGWARQVRQIDGDRASDVQRGCSGAALMCSVV